jgi:hypothetical protein
MNLKLVDPFQAPISFSSPLNPKGYNAITALFNQYGPKSRGYSVLRHPLACVIILAVVSVAIIVLIFKKVISGQNSPPPAPPKNSPPPAPPNCDNSAGPRHRDRADKLTPPNTILSPPSFPLSQDQPFTGGAAEARASAATAFPETASPLEVPGLKVYLSKKPFKDFEAFLGELKCKTDILNNLVNKSGDKRFLDVVDFPRRTNLPGGGNFLDLVLAPTVTFNDMGLGFDRAVCTAELPLHPRETGLTYLTSICVESQNRLSSITEKSLDENLREEGFSDDQRNEAANFIRNSPAVIYSALKSMYPSNTFELFTPSDGPKASIALTNNQSLAIAISSLQYKDTKGVIYKLVVTAMLNSDKKWDLNLCVFAFSVFSHQKPETLTIQHLHPNLDSGISTNSGYLPCYAEIPPLLNYDISSLPKKDNEDVSSFAKKICIETLKSDYIEILFEPLRAWIIENWPSQFAIVQELLDADRVLSVEKVDQDSEALRCVVLFEEYSPHELHMSQAGIQGKLWNKKNLTIGCLLKKNSDGTVSLTEIVLLEKIYATVISPWYGYFGVVGNTHLLKNWIKNPAEVEKCIQANPRLHKTACKRYHSSSAILRIKPNN